MTTKEARSRIEAYGKSIVSDAYLNMKLLREIVYALPTTQEAIDFLMNVRRRARDAAESEKESGGGFSRNFHQQRRNALKLCQELEKTPMLF